MQKSSIYTCSLHVNRPFRTGSSFQYIYKQIRNHGMIGSMLPGRSGLRIGYNIQWESSWEGVTGGPTWDVIRILMVGPRTTGGLDEVNLPFHSSPKGCGGQSMSP